MSKGVSKGASKDVSKGVSKGVSRRRQLPTARGNARQRAHSYQRGEEIVALLRRHGPLSVAALADRLPISAAGIRSHLRVLEAWGIVQTRLETVEERDARRYRLPKAEQERMRRSPRQILYAAVAGAAHGMAP